MLSNARALRFALASAGTIIAMSSAMIEITTSSSTIVKAFRRFLRATDCRNRDSISHSPGVAITGFFNEGEAATGYIIISIYQEPCKFIISNYMQIIILSCVL